MQSNAKQSTAQHGTQNIQQNMHICTRLMLFQDRKSVVIFHRMFASRKDDNTRVTCMSG